MLDRLRLDDGRGSRAMADAVREVADLPDPVGEVDARRERAQRARGSRACASRSGVIAIDLRVAPQRHHRRRGALPQDRQRGDPARRLGGDPLQPRARRGDRRGRSRRAACRRRRCRSCRPPSARRSRAAQAGGRHRPGHPARRRGPDPLRGRALAHPGHQALQGRLPRLRRRRRRPRHGAGHLSSTARCSGPASATRSRPCWSTAPSPPHSCRGWSPRLRRAAASKCAATRRRARWAAAPCVAAAEDDWGAEYLA